MKIGYLGLGKMGRSMVFRMHEKGHAVIAWNRSEEPRREAEAGGVPTVDTIENVVKALEAPRTVWVMVPEAAVDEVLSELMKYLEKGDVIVDGGNSYFRKTQERAKLVLEKGFKFLDAGTSGGPGGARNGACIMVGGEQKDFNKLEPLFRDLSAPEGFLYCGAHGAGHFVKMVHNGIEYGMMQSIAEGFEILQKSEFDLDLKKVTNLYNHGSVVTSRLVGWLGDGFEKYGDDLDEITSTVAHTGEGEWTIKTANELGVEAKVIKDAFEFRVHSGEKSSFACKVLSVMRNMFGGHSAK